MSEKKKGGGMKAKPNKDFPYVQVRLSPEIKQKWITFAKENGFTYVSSLIKFAVDNYMKHGENVQDKQNSMTVVKELMEIMKADKKEYMNKIDELLQKEQEKEQLDVNKDHSGKFLRILETYSTTAENIAYTENIDEKVVLKVLNQLAREKLVKSVHSKKEGLMWEVIHNGD